VVYYSRAYDIGSSACLHGGILFHSVECVHLQYYMIPPRPLSLSFLPSFLPLSLPPFILPPLISFLFIPFLSSPEIGATAGIFWKLSNGIHLVCSKWSCKPLYLTFKNLRQLLYCASCNSSVHCSDIMTPSSGRFTLD